jgi:hypothetical protein
MKWATRAGIHVDRTACAWLIRRFIDERAQFVFVHDPDDVPDDATAFDMRGVELSHHGDACTFETMLDRYRLDDPALAAVRPDRPRGRPRRRALPRPEARGLDVILRGLSMVVESDEQMLELSGPIYDGLYEYERRATMLGGTRG